MTMANTFLVSHTLGRSDVGSSYALLGAIQGVTLN
jgi:hypothetical protein